MQYCNVHGLLSCSAFFRDDLFFNRHRCKECIREKTRKWRRDHPWRTIWQRFRQRAKRQREGDEVKGWSEQGECIKRLLMKAGAMRGMDPLQLELTWTEDEGKELQLITRADAMRRRKRRKGPEKGEVVKCRQVCPFGGDRQKTNERQMKDKRQIKLTSIAAAILSFHSTFHLYFYYLYLTPHSSTTHLSISIHNPLSLTLLTVLSNRMSAPKYQKIKTKVGAIWSVRRNCAPRRFTATTRKRKNNATTSSTPSILPTASIAAFPQSVEEDDDDCGSNNISFDSIDSDDGEARETGEARYYRLLDEQNKLVYHGHGYYILPLYDESKSELSRRSYCHIRRVDRVYTCNCTAFLSSNNQNHCWHMSYVTQHNEKLERTLQQLQSSSSSSSSSSPSTPLDDLPPVSPTVPTVVLVDSYDGYWIADVFSVIVNVGAPAIVFRRDVYKKVSCQLCKTKCEHTAAVKEYLKEQLEVEGEEEEKEIDEIDELNDEEVEVEEQEAISFKPIPVPNWARLPSDITYDTPPSRVNIAAGTILYPRKCDNSSCSHLFDINSIQCVNQDAILYNDRFAIGVGIVPRIQCEKCGAFTVYDGVGERIFNYNNARLFTHQLLNQYTARFTSSPTTFTAFIQSISRMYDEYRQPNSELFIPLITKPTFIRVFFSYIQRQAWGYSYQCSVCGPHPSSIIADGITLSLPSLYCSKLTPPTTVDANLPQVIVSTPASHEFVAGESREERGMRIARGVRYIGNRKLADLLNQFTGKLFARDKPVVELDDPKVKSMIELAKRHEKELYALVSYMELDRDENKLLLAMRLIRILSSDEPLQQFMHFPLPQLTLKLCNNLQLWRMEKVQQCLQLFSPYMYELFKRFGVEVPSVIVEVLREAARRAEAMQRLAEQDRGMPERLAEGDERGGSDRLNDRYRKSGCYYGMDSIRIRPSYNRDSKDSSNISESGSCTKLFPKYRDISGGAMILWCRHRIAVGFHIIPKSEGRNDVFSAILTHWPVAPRVVCYDFSCDLMQYSTIREPTYFKHTMFVIDRLHIKNHTTCSEAFSLKSYHNSGAQLYCNFPDQAAEAGNALLRWIRLSCLYMSNGRFMDYVRLFLEVQNRRRTKIVAMQQQTNANTSTHAQSIQFGYDEMVVFIESLQ